MQHSEEYYSSELLRYAVKVGNNYTAIQNWIHSKPLDEQIWYRCAFMNNFNLPTYYSLNP